MTRLKICGLRDADNALVAANAGADFLGFVFVEGVRRQLSVDEAVRIIAEYRDSHGPGGPKLVSLFADQSANFINETTRRCGVDLVQLCGNESPAFWDAIEADIIRQVKVREDPGDESTVDNVRRKVEEAVSAGHMVTLDKYHPDSLGGTGLSFDWTIAEEVSREFDLLLAGGLTPENVAIGIQTVHPWGVDVSSGVETDGAKDPLKIVAFADAVRKISN